MNYFLGKGDTLISCHVSELNIINVVLYTDFIQLLFIHSYLPKRLSYTVIFRLWWTWPLSLHQCTSISFSGNYNRVFWFFVFLQRASGFSLVDLWMSWQSSTALFECLGNQALQRVFMTYEWLSIQTNIFSASGREEFHRLKPAQPILLTLHNVARKLTGIGMLNSSLELFTSRVDTFII